MKWISIKDNKPPNNVPLLFYREYMESSHDNAPVIVRKIIVGKILKGSMHIIGDHWQYLKLGVTHWMPLPEFPEATNILQKKSKNDPVNDAPIGNANAH